MIDNSYLSCRNSADLKTRLLVGVISSVLLTIVGCGKPSPGDLTNTASVNAEEDEPRSPQVDPFGSKADTPGDPPGLLELPADFDPEKALESSQPTGNGRGIEMPPINDSSSTKSDLLPSDLERVLTSTPLANPQPDESGQPNTTSDAAGGVSLKGASWETIERFIKETGKLTVVDFWSLACEPCLKEFPGLVRIHRELGDKVACVSVDVDFDGRKTKPAESYRPRIEEFLRSVEATFQNLLCETASDDVFTAIGIDSIPAVLIYDSDGVLLRKFIDVGEDAGFTYEKNVIPFVKQALDPNR